MSPVQRLRAFVNQRLAAAAEEIFELFERTIAEYEEKVQVPPQQKLVDAVSSPGETRGPRADIQLALVVTDTVSPSVEQEKPEAPPHIKEEQDELWSRQEREQLQGLTEADIKFVSVKSEEDDGEEARSSQLHQRQTKHMETEADGEDCGGAELDRSSHPHTHSEADTDYSCNKQNLGRHVTVPTGEKHFSCSVCSKRFRLKETLEVHIKTHTGEKPFSFSFYKKSFSQSGSLKAHLRSHTGEKPFSCSVSEKTFSRKQLLKSHMRTHTGEKPFTCSVCQKSFTQRGSLNTHMRIHTGERPFSCSVCDKSFTQSGSLNIHMRSHTGEKPFSCSMCDKSFTQSGSLHSHMRLHMVFVQGKSEDPHDNSHGGTAFQLRSLWKTIGPEYDFTVGH